MVAAANIVAPVVEEARFENEINLLYLLPSFVPFPFPSSVYPICGNV
jgi:hypothetical protein